MKQYRRQPIGPHKPNIDSSNSKDLGAYFSGISQGQSGGVYDPRLTYTKGERESYRAGFDIARTMPRA